MQVLEIKRHVLGLEHPDTVTAMDDLAEYYIAEAKYAQAEVLFKQDLELERRVLGPEHSETLKCMANLGLTYGLEGKYPEAEALLHHALEIAQRVLGPENDVSTVLLLYTAATYQQQAKYSLAEENAAQALAGLRHSVGLDSPDTLDAVPRIRFLQTPHMLLIGPVDAYKGDKLRFRLHSFLT